MLSVYGVWGLGSRGPLPAKMLKLKRQAALASPPQETWINCHKQRPKPSTVLPSGHGLHLVLRKLCDTDSMGK